MSAFCQLQDCSNMSFYLIKGVSIKGRKYKFSVCKKCYPKVVKLLKEYNK